MSHHRAPQQQESTPRLALQPLLDALPIDHTLARPDVPGPGVAAQAARLLGVSVRHLHRLNSTGLSPATADRLAITAGLHPLIVWGDTWSHAMRAHHDLVHERRAPYVALRGSDSSRSW